MEYGFTYTNLTRQYTSLYQGTVQPINSTALRVQTDLGSVIQYGMRNVSLSVIDDSPSVQAIYVNLSISSSDGLNLTQVDHNGTYIYAEEIQPHTYDAVIPLIEPGEAIPFNITLVASVGAGDLNITATGYSPSGVMVTTSTTNQLQVTVPEFPGSLVFFTVLIAVLMAMLVERRLGHHRSPA